MYRENRDTDLFVLRFASLLDYVKSPKREGVKLEQFSVTGNTPRISQHYCRSFKFDVNKQLLQALICFYKYYLPQGSPSEVVNVI